MNGMTFSFAEGADQYVKGPMYASDNDAKNATIANTSVSTELTGVTVYMPDLSSLADTLQSNVTVPDVDNFKQNNLLKQNIRFITLKPGWNMFGALDDAFLLFHNGNTSASSFWTYSTTGYSPLTNQILYKEGVWVYNSSSSESKMLAYKL